MKLWVQRAAEKVAKRSTYKYRHGAVLESGGRIIGQGYNQLRPSCPQTACSIHAEVAALRSAIGRTQGCDLYVARLAGDRLGMSLPCIKCQVVIRASKVARVFYSSQEGWRAWNCKS